MCVLNIALFGASVPEVQTALTLYRERERERERERHIALFGASVPEVQTALLFALALTRRRLMEKCLESAHCMLLYRERERETHTL
jgi:hypothetical protein